MALVLAQSGLALPSAAQGIRAVTRPVILSPTAGVFFQQPIFSGGPALPQAQAPARFEPALVPGPRPRAASSEEVARKTLEFQIKRAEAGAAHAQFDLGVRYLSGDGVKKNLGTARKWLSEAAKNGNAQAAKKLEEIKNASEQPATLD